MQSAEGLVVTLQVLNFKIQIHSYLTRLLIDALKCHPDFCSPETAGFNFILFMD